MSAEITVSVCIANYNGMDVIDDCIRSVQNQIGNIAVEILVYDDASTDTSVLHIQKNYPDVRLIISEKNVGFCIANNRMAALANGKYLLLLNNDAALYPDGLSALLNEANTLNKPAILTLPQYDATTGALVDRGCLLDPFYNPVPNLDPARNDVAMVIGACLWIPKKLWDELKGFPDWFGSIAEDMYLCCMARLAGNVVKALDASGYRHWQGKSFGGGKVDAGKMVTTLRRRALSERNKTFVVVMTFPPLWLVLWLPIHLLLLAVEGVLLAMLRLNVNYLKRIYLPVFIGLWRNRIKLHAGRGRGITARRYIEVDFFTSFDWIPYKLRMLWRYGLPHLT